MKTIVSRQQVWQDTLQMVKVSPVGGVGLGNWKIEFPKYYRSVEDASRQVVRPHNDFLWILAEVGVIALLIYLTLITIQFKYLIQSLFSKDVSKHKLIFLLGV